MPVPKRKTSKSKRDKRRTHQKTEAPNLSICPECREERLPHHACPNCGTYKGKVVIDVDDDWFLYIVISLKSFGLNKKIIEILQTSRMNPKVVWVLNRMDFKSYGFRWLSIHYHALKTWQSIRILCDFYKPHLR